MAGAIHIFPIAKSYVSHWGMVEGIREIIQNALDSDSAFEYEWEELKTFENTPAWALKIHSRDTVLETRTLLLGQSSKTNDDSKIGSFGEGYKIAMLVLTRAGYDVEMLNGPVRWRPTFEYDDKYGEELFTVREENLYNPNEGLTFEVHGLTNNDREAISESCLRMQKDIGEIVTVKQGSILRDRPGKLYVGGLYICDTELTFGYNVKPEYIKLERDRKTVDSYDLKDLVKDMWLASGRTAEIAEMLMEDVIDLEYLRFGIKPEVCEAVYTHFTETNPGVVAARDQTQLEILRQRGVEAIIVPSNFFEAISTSNAYRADPPIKPVRIPTPLEALSAYFDRNKKHMRSKAIVEMKEILVKAKNWRL